MIKIIALQDVPATKKAIFCKAVLQSEFAEIELAAGFVSTAGKAIGKGTTILTVPEAFADKVKATTKPAQDKDGNPLQDEHGAPLSFTWISIG